jgi:organic radical activating enzyme
MTKLTESIRSMFAAPQPVQAGMYHYISPQDDPRNYRLHLRVEEDGSGVLIVNAATVLHLNQTATEYAYYFVHNTPADEAARKMARRYHVGVEQAFNDYRELGQRILTLVEMPDLDPVTYMDFARAQPYSGRLSAPYRLDCALTYRLPAGENPDFAPTKRVERELNTAEWAQVLEKAWAAGIPHVVFTGGEPTLRDDLPTLIEHAEYLGQVSGLLTDGLKLADPDYLDALLRTGLDHLLLVYQADRDAWWNALANCLKADIFTGVHLTLTSENKEVFAGLIQRLAQAQATAISLSAASPDLAADLQAGRALAADLHMELVWDLPVPYSAQNPISLELPDAETPQGAGRAWLYVEPDGDVLPGQGMEGVLGNILNQGWEEIWAQAQHR